MNDLELTLRELLVPAGVARAELLEACATVRAVSALSPELLDDAIKRMNAASEAYAERCKHVVSVLYGFQPDLFVSFQGEPELQRAPGETGDELCPDRIEPGW